MAGSKWIRSRPGCFEKIYPSGHKSLVKRDGKFWFWEVFDGEGDQVASRAMYNTARDARDGADSCVGLEIMK